MKRLRSGFPKAEDSPGFLLWKAANLMQRLHERGLRELDITSTQLSVMLCLVYLSGEGPVTPTGIAAHAGIDKMLVSDLVKTLRGKKLLTTRKNPLDGRSLLLEPTALGAKVANAAVVEVEAIDAQFFSRIEDVARFHEDLLALVHEP